MTYLQGAPNFRDFGGHRIRDGRKVRTGRLYRSEVLTELGTCDSIRLERINFGLVCDLRGGSERAAGADWPHKMGPKLMHLPMHLDLKDVEPPMLRILIANPTPNGALAAILATYADMPRAMERHLKALFDQLLAPPHQPVLIHCRYGKDRTGFVTALILLALGVPIGTIFEDYMTSEQRIDASEISRQMAMEFIPYLGTSVDPATMLPLAQTRRAYLQAAFEAVAKQYGSLVNYLRDHAQLNRRKLRALRSIYLE
jgi:protein-tyrosine phosphatase